MWVILACSDYGSSTSYGGGSALLRIVQSAAAPTAVQVRWKGQPIGSSLAPGGVSALLNVSSGTAALELGPTGGGTASSHTLTLADKGRYTIIAQDSSGVLVPQLLEDTNAIVAAGKSKLRVIHSATQAAAIDIWRTQPDFQTLITIMTPFNYQAASPYLESDPGEWSIVVTPQAQTDTLFTSGPINVGVGKLVTVVVIDSSVVGGIDAVVIHDN
jgi:hypothetical protein